MDLFQPEHVYGVYIYSTHRPAGDGALTMLSTRDLGLGATIDVANVPQTQKYIVAVLLGIAICETEPRALPGTLFISPAFCGCVALLLGQGHAGSWSGLHHDETTSLCSSTQASPEKQLRGHWHASSPFSLRGHR